MIFLVSRRVEPLFNDGHVSIALMEGNSEDDAINKAVEIEKEKLGMESNKHLVGEYNAIGLNQGFVKIEVIEDTANL